MEPKPSFNPRVPSIARTYDYLLGGKDHYPVDREIGEIFGDMRLTPPGIAPCAQWQPNTDPGDLTLYQHLIAAGLGRK
jgi:S-adenosyl methyltransferase